MRILLVTARSPWPARRGDQLRAQQFIDALAPHHDVTVLAPHAEAEADPDERVRVLRYERGSFERVVGLLRAAMEGRPLQCGWYDCKDLERQLTARAHRADLVIFQLLRTSGSYAATGGRPLLVDLIDCLSLNFSRRAGLDSRWLAPLLRWEATRLGEAERRLLSSGAHSCVVCDRDSARLLRDVDAGGRHSVVPLAVEPWRQARGESSSSPSEARRRWTLALTGNLGYFVNRDGLEWWIREVWERLRLLRPDVTMVVSGSRARRSTLRLLAAADGVDLIEEPPDLRELLSSADIAIAPLRAGAGVPVKVLEAWSVGTPVVASRWAAAGTSGVPGVDLEVADEPAEWIQVVSDLLDAPRRRELLAQSALSRLRSDYSRAVTSQALLEAVSAAARNPTFS